MQVNGFQIKQELKMLQLSKEALEQELGNTYAKFEEDKITRTPKAVIDELSVVERKIALFQTAQAQYNQLTTVELDGKTVPLAYVIKLEGVVNRIAKIWKGTSKQAASSNARYGLDKDQKYPVSQVIPKECFDQTKALMMESTKLQGIIGTANARQQKIDILG